MRHALPQFLAAVALPLLAIRAAQAAPPATALAASPDGSHVVAGSTAGVEIRSAADLAPQGRLTTNLEHVAALAFSPDGTYLAAAGGVPAESGLVEVYAWPQLELVRRWDFAVDLVYAVDWSADGSSLAAACFDGTAWQLSVQPADETADRQWHPGHSRGLTAVCLLPIAAGGGDVPLAVTAGIDQTLRVIDVRTGKPLRTLHNHTAGVHALAVQPTSDAPLPVVASISDDRTVRFWQPTIGRMMRFVRLETTPLCLSWCSDGSRLITGCADGALRVINPQTAAVIDTRPVADSPLLSLATMPGESAVIVGTHAGEVRRVVLEVDRSRPAR
jgi:WD40 repeat protein